MELRDYEITLIFDPKLPKGEIKQIVDHNLETITDQKGKIVDWGQPIPRALAYPIRKQSHGIYQTIRFQAPSNAIDKLEIFCKRESNIWRFLTVRLTKEALAFYEKLKAIDIEEATSQD